MKQTIITALPSLVTLATNAAVADSMGRNLEDYDYLAGFVEGNYAPFDAIMQKGYKGGYKCLKKRIGGQLCKGGSDLEEATSDYIIWFYSEFDRHLEVETRELKMGEGNMMS